MTDANFVDTPAYFLPPTLSPSRQKPPRRVRLLATLAFVALIATNIVVRVTLIRTPPTYAVSHVTAAQRRTLAPVLSDVVDINVTSANEIRRGTGVVLSANGLVVTNNHVISGADTLRVIDRGNDRTYDATVLGYSAQLDVAVLQLHGAKHLSHVTRESTRRAPLGALVFSVGNAQGLDTTPSITSGRVVAYGQHIVASAGPLQKETLNGLLQTTTGVVPGDSGGPLFSTHATLLGLNVAGAPTNETNVEKNRLTTSFVIPLATVLTVVKLVRTSLPSPLVHRGPGALLGVEVKNAPHGGGALVLGVVRKTPAQEAGLRSGDVITQVNRVRVRDASQTVALTTALYPGAKIYLVWRTTHHQYRHTHVTLATGPAW